MNEPVCRQCTYFHRHYVIDDTRCVPIGCGHCSYPHLKHRKPEAPGCRYFEKRAGEVPLPDREAVVNFLTVDLLEHILSLPLPPVVEREET